MALPVKAMGEWYYSAGDTFAMDANPCWADIRAVSTVPFMIRCGQNVFAHFASLNGAQPVLRVYGVAKERGWFDKSD